MDDLLKTYAKKRREEADAPMEMHPATRRLLQSEAAKLKTGALPSSTSWLEALKIFWPRLAFAAGMLFIAGIVAVTFLGPEDQKAETMQMAMQDTETAAADRYDKSQPPAESQLAKSPASLAPAKPGARPAVIEDQSGRRAPARRAGEALSELATIGERGSVEAEKKMKQVDLVQNELRNNVTMIGEAGRAVAEPTAGTAPADSRSILLSVVTVQKSDDSVPATGGRRADAPIVASEAADFFARSAPKQAAGLDSSLKEEQPAVAQLSDGKAVTASFSATAVQQEAIMPTTRSRFANVHQVGRQNLGKASIAYDATVLVNFVVEQSGERLRVVDGDGSVYEGKVLYGEAAAIAEYDTKLDYAADTRFKVVKDEQSRQQQNARVLDPTAAAAWNFRVSGTNRTLQQPVIVDGILFETAASNSLNQAGTKVSENLLFYRVPPAQAPTQQGSYGLSASPNQNSAQAPSGQASYGGQSMNLLNAGRIQGQVRVGATNQIPLDAVRDANQP